MGAVCTGGGTPTAVAVPGSPHSRSEQRAIEAANAAAAAEEQKNARPPALAVPGSSEPTGHQFHAPNSAKGENGGMQKKSLHPLSLPSTPIGKDKEVYKFFCPVCLEYFREIHKTACCSNNICENCALKHLTVKLKLTAPHPTMPSGQRFPTVECPLCNVKGVTFLYVHPNELARGYQESPHTKELLLAVERRANGSTGAVNAAGDDASFDHLKKKILEFDADTTHPLTSQHRESDSSAAGSGAGGNGSEHPPPPALGSGLPLPPKHPKRVHAANGSSGAPTPTGGVSAAGALSPPMPVSPANRVVAHPSPQHVGVVPPPGLVMLDTKHHSSDGPLPPGAGGAAPNSGTNSAIAAAALAAEFPFSSPAKVRATARNSLNNSSKHHTSPPGDESNSLVPSASAFSVITPSPTAGASRSAAYEKTHEPELPGTVMAVTAAAATAGSIKPPFDEHKTRVSPKSGTTAIVAPPLTTAVPPSSIVISSSSALPPRTAAELAAIDLADERAAQLWIDAQNNRAAGPVLSSNDVAESPLRPTGPPSGSPAASHAATATASGIELINVFAHPQSHAAPAEAPERVLFPDSTPVAGGGVGAAVLAIPSPDAGSRPPNSALISPNGVSATFGVDLPPVSLAAAAPTPTAASATATAAPAAATTIAASTPTPMG